MASAEFIGPGARLQSVLAVEELAGMLPLHEAIPLAAKRKGPRDFGRWKRGLIVEMARLTKILHSQRHFHKDLYLCHFYIPEVFTRTLPAWTGQVFMIDFHRLTAHPLTWPVWQVKDLAELLYSSAVEGVGPRDRLRFWRHYLTARPGIAASLLKLLILAKWRRYRTHNAKRQSRASRLARFLPNAVPEIIMKIAFCYESVLPARGGCETYISDLARRLSLDHHEVHLYACRWDPESLPPDLQVHLLPEVHGPRFLRPWLFAASCAKRCNRRNTTLPSASTRRGVRMFSIRKGASTPRQPKTTC